MKFTPEERRKIIMVVTIVTISLLIYTLLQNIPILVHFFSFILGLVSPFLTAFILAFIVNIPMQFLERQILDHFKIKASLKRMIAIILSYLIIIGLIVFVLSTVIPQLVDSSSHFVSGLNSTITKIEGWLEDNDFFQRSIDAIEQVLPFTGKQSFANVAIDFLNKNTQGLKDNILGSILSTVGNVFSGVVTAFIAFVFSIYVLNSKEVLSRQIKELLYSFFPEKTTDHLLYFSYTLYDNFYNFFTGQFIEALILGIMCFIGMKILNFPYAIVISVFTGFGALIPLVGALLPGLIGALMIVTLDLVQGLGFAVFIVSLQQFEGNLVYPKVVGRSVGLPAMWVLFAITLGAASNGLFGMLVAVPLASTIYDLLTDFKTRRLDKQNIDVSKK